jgi:hypothetical protein
MTGWNALFDQARPAFSQQRSFARARTLGLSALTCLGRHTLSGLLCATGQQFGDWSAAYRLFERERLQSEALWRVPLNRVLETLPPARPIVALIDDTLLRKRGHRIAGTSWRRDPLGPHFADNFIWASRFLQISLALPEHPEAPVSAARAIPVDLLHAPSPRKPSRRADPAGPEWQSWRAASAASAISRCGAERRRHLRQAIDQFADGTSRALLVCADATFTNRTVLRDLPPRTTLLGRIRKDARLYARPTAEEENQGRGRHRCYGQRRPTPEQWRRDKSIPWKTVHAFAAGNVYDFDIKFITPLRWKNAGGERQLSLLIVRPVAYRLRKGAHLSYRKPAYLICSDPAVRTTATFFVFVYALLLLALDNGHLTHSPLPRPRWQRWRPQRHPPRITTTQAISLLRADLWASALHLQNKNGFAAPDHPAAKPLIIENHLQSAVLYASG